MNRFEKTHEELKRQLASLGIYDSDCPAEVFLTVDNEKVEAEKIPATFVLEEQQGQNVDAGLANS